MPISASSKAKAKQAVQSRAFQVPPVAALCHIGAAITCVFFCFEICQFVLLPPWFIEFKAPLLLLWFMEFKHLVKPNSLLLQVTQSLADVFNEFDFLGDAGSRN